MRCTFPVAVQPPSGIHGNVDDITSRDIQGATITWSRYSDWHEGCCSWRAEASRWQHEQNFRRSHQKGWDRPLPSYCRSDYLFTSTTSHAYGGGYRYRHYCHLLSRMLFAAVILLYCLVLVLHSFISPQNVIAKKQNRNRNWLNITKQNKNNYSNSLSLQFVLCIFTTHYIQLYFTI